MISSTQQMMYRTVYRIDLCSPVYNVPTFLDESYCTNITCESSGFHYGLFYSCGMGSGFYCLRYCSFQNEHILLPLSPWCWAGDRCQLVLVQYRQFTMLCEINGCSSFYCVCILYKATINKIIIRRQWHARCKIITRTRGVVL